MKKLHSLTLVLIFYSVLPLFAQTEVQEKLQSFSKYDFVPGDRILLFEDFSSDALGDFPALWTTNGSGEVKTLNLYAGKWLHLLAADMRCQPAQSLNLPENFIFEFDVVPVRQPESEEASFELFFFWSEDEQVTDELFPGAGGFKVTCTENSWKVIGYDEGANNINEGSTELAPVQNDKLNHVILWIQKRRVRIYHLGQKVVDLPTVIYAGQKLNRLQFSLQGCGAFPYISNLRFTSAAPDTRNKLITEGKLISYGIYFDSGKELVKAESYGALGDIAKVLKDNPEVRIKITGHTDSDGIDDTNLDLSKRRAASVKNELFKTFGIEVSRMETDGKGETEPIGSNATAGGKAQNRRVEFTKL